MATNPTLITTPFAESGDKTTPPNTNVPSDGRFSQTLGFPPVTAIPLGSGGKAPKREDFNGAFNMLANLLFYAQKGWIFQWDSGQTYYAGCIVRYSGNLYACTADVTSTTAPSSDTSHWSKYNIAPGTTYAPINSPAFTGTPTAPTPSSGDNSTKLATTAFVQSAIREMSGDYVVDTYRSGENWYRKYNSGWLEQGGVSNSIAQNITVNMNKAFADSNYTLIAVPYSYNSPPNYSAYVATGAKTTTTFWVRMAGTVSSSYEYASWFACGMGANS